MRTMHVGADLGEDEMDEATGDIVAPDFVKRAKRFEFEFEDAGCDVGVLLIGAGAALLNPRAQDDGDEFLEYERGEVDACSGLDPGFDVGDPGVVAFDAAVRVELPEGDLGEDVRVCEKRGGWWQMRLTCARVETGWLWSIVLVLVSYFAVRR